MYDRELDGREFTFAVSGKLWNHSLVMIDSQTESEWSHLLGKCMKGELKNRVLTSIPSVITDWKTWKRLYPKTRVLYMSPTSHEYSSDFYRFPKHDGIVFGIEIDGVAKAYEMEMLEEANIVQDQIGDVSFVLHYDQASRSARGFFCQLDGQKLEFRTENDQVLDNLDRAWNLELGQTVSSDSTKPLQLKSLTIYPSFKGAWKIFHPETEFFTP